ncbi:hypothetical protein K438DRAFT_2179456 [Mycena galopus ATCC 62051]|nr:hypothetical protein K438DRAFT_2179456 [Mycena galopus ATCC 62051]
MSSSRIQFPANPNRPQTLGRSQREHQATAGLLNHQQQNKNNREKAAKAKATRAKNATTSASGPGAMCRPPSAPLTPTTAQNRPPPTLQNRPPPTPSTTAPGLHITNNTPNIRTVTPPTYPNFPSLPRQNTNDLNNPNSSPSPNPHLQRMGGMNPGVLPQINTYTSPNPGASPQLSYFANPHTEWAGGNIDYGSSGGLGAHSGGDGLGNGVSGGGGSGESPSAGDDERAPEERWDNPQGAEGEEDDHQNDHENAQSSLEASFHVSMHDVDVRRRGHKRSAQETGLTSDAEDCAPHSSSAKSRRKRRNRRQKSRSVRELSGDSRRAVEAAYPFIQKAVCLEVPWPLASPSGDPLADDDDFEILIDNAYDAAVSFLGLDPEDFNSTSLTTDERNLIRARITQVRGSIMTEATKLVQSCYGFVDVGSLEDPTPENIEATLEANRQLVADLEGTFMYEDPKATSDIATIYKHKIFQQLLNAAFFASKGINRRSHYFRDVELLPYETLALLCDAIVCGIDRWKTGRYAVKGDSFNAETYGRLHEDSVTFLKAWVAEYTKDVHPVNLAEARLRELLTNARKLIDEPAAQVVTRLAKIFYMILFLHSGVDGYSGLSPAAWVNGPGDRIYGVEIMPMGETHARSRSIWLYGSMALRAGGVSLMLTAAAKANATSSSASSSSCASADASPASTSTKNAPPSWSAVVARPRGIAQAFDGGEGAPYREAAQASPTPSGEHLALEAEGGEAGGSFRTSGSGKSTTALDGGVGGDSVDAWSAGNVRGSSEFAVAMSFSPFHTTLERPTLGAGGSTRSSKITSREVRMRRLLGSQSRYAFVPGA